MNDRIEVRKPLIDPIYSQAEANETIDLGQVPVQFDHDGNTHRETANVTMKFVPDDRLQFVVPLEGKHPFFGMKLIAASCDDMKLTLTDRGKSFDAFVAATGDEYGGIVFCPKRSAITVTPQASALSTATFHLFNFPEFRGPEDYILRTGEPPREGCRSCGCVVLKADGWRITVAATDQTGNLVKSLRAQGGYALTHMGQIEREDGTAFTSEQLDDVLSCLQYFLSFALGRWAGVALPIGFDAEGNKVYEQWGLGRTADGRWNASCSWWHDLHGGWLSQVFPGFMSLWKSDLWQQPLTHALYWYVQACDRSVGIGVDTALILAQAALELLAWNHCVQDRKMVSAVAFKPRGLSAADKLRLLASSMDIPKEIPPGLSALCGRPGQKWKDGMDAITEIRNSLVHPHSQLRLPDDSSYEAWKLSLWYIDLVLLRLCGYGGMYADRLATSGVRTVGHVPWARKETDKDSSAPNTDTHSANVLTNDAQRKSS